VLTSAVQPAWHLYVVRHPEADRLISALAHAGIQARGYYRTPIHRQPAMALWGSSIELPATDDLARTNLALPMSPVLKPEQASQVTDVIAAALAGDPAASIGSVGAR